MGINNSRYFYHATTRKLITIFGVLFNDIRIARTLTDGTLANVTRVPIAYGPRAKFLEAIKKRQGENLEIKLPRMSYELTSITYDAESKLNSTNKRRFSTADGSSTSAREVPYTLGFDLTILGRTLDDMFQIAEQILPMFTPDYTVAINDISGPGTTTDIPFVLSGLAMSDEYEGDFIATRPITWTLSFTTKAKYLGAINEAKIILRVEAALRDLETQGFFEKIVEKVDDPTSFISSIDPNDEFEVVLAGAYPVEYVVGENVVGSVSGFGALVVQVNTNSIKVIHLENEFEDGEELEGQTSGESREIVSYELL